MPEEKFWKSTIRQMDKLIELDRSYETSILFEVVTKMYSKPAEIEVESLLDI